MTWKGRILVLLGVLVVVLVGVYAVAALNGDKSSSSGAGVSGGASIQSSPTSARGAEETNGPASFLGHASNAVMFVQWTRSGQNVTGSLREAIKKEGTLSLEDADRAFTGVIDGKGITLSIKGALGESTSYVGEVVEDGFSLTVPGQGSNLITITFVPGGVSEYDEATKQLLAAQYSSPCSLYVVGHEVRVSIAGPNAAEDCASFVQRAGGTEWTTAPQAGAEAGAVVCEVENRASEKATITDNGGQSYGKAACTQLSGEGWG